ncbi:aminotransferase class III-fold pyridoxal phosphate-dependent enzyme, partial [Pseudomonas sp.]|uniref:aminotransferase class III-fold pyridoxal phosphate-dependent enzyme n=1 Tax=Pseudomonas sp. TaxID=306 RepID=UPI00258D90B1
FGSVFFGHRPDFVVEAVHRQIDRDIIIGPQNPVAGECAKLFAELTGHERVAFCNTGSEAVLAAIRLARTVTGRNLIIQHEGDYHGITDEVLVRSTPSGKTVPAAPGVPPESVANTIVLEYGSAESLAVIRERAHELAAVVIEPVQSRKPDLQPADYVREVRRICDESGTALIMDEVVCGFRVHRAGAQGVWGVKADIGCYGKVFGAGMAVGALADRLGRRRVLWATIVSMLGGIGLTLFTPLWLVIPGMLVFTFGFFGAHSVASSWIGRRAVKAKGQASSLYLFCYYAGSSVAGTTGGFFWHLAGWNGIGGFIVALLLGALLVALKLAKLPPLASA